MGTRLDKVSVPRDDEVCGRDSHFYWRHDPALLQSQIEQLVDRGLLVELTEVDLPIYFFATEPDPLAAQAQMYARIFDACMSVPACKGITTWGIDDGDTWLDNTEPMKSSAPNRPLLFDELGQPKLAYDAVVGAMRARITPVGIDVRPRSPFNLVLPASPGLLPVAVLGSGGFDVSQVDPDTLAFGPARVQPVGWLRPRYPDIDDDGTTDLLARFRISQTGIEATDQEACLSGHTLDGGAFLGCDRIETLGGCGLGAELALVLPLLLALHRSRGVAGGARRGAALEQLPEEGGDELQCAQ